MVASLLILLSALSLAFVAVWVSEYLFRHRRRA